MPEGIVKSLVRRTLAALGAIALAIAPPLHAQARTATIEGSVKDANSGRAIEAAQVYLDGTTSGAVTNSQGAYRLVVPLPSANRTFTVKVRFIGYNPQNKIVTVVEGQTIKADFGLTQSALQLNQVVVTGSGQATEVKRLGNTVAVVQPPKDMPQNDVSQLLQGREPGLVGLPTGGLSGEGARIRIRGNASLTQSNEPIVFVDGVRINSGGGFNVGTGGGGQASRLDDIDPNSIERMEVLKGAAAATLYGTEASNGVIQIFTKKGSVSAPRWTMSLQNDFSQYPDRVAPNSFYAKTQTQADALSAHWGFPITPFNVYEIPVFKNNLTETGIGTTAAATVQGGGPSVTYFVSGRYQNENGPFGGRSLGPAQDAVKRAQTNLNVQLVPTSNLRVGVRGSYFNTQNETPENNNNIYGVNSLATMARPEFANCNASATTGKGTCTGAGNPFGNQAFMTVRESMQQTNVSQVGRYVGNVDLQWTPTPGLTYSVLGGFDFTSQRDVGFSPFGYNLDLFTTQTTAGARTAFDARTRVITLDSKLAWNKDKLPMNLSSAFVAGLQVFNNRTTTTSGSSQDFPGPGIAVTGAGGAQIVVGESYLTTINGGYFAQEQIGWRDYVFATIGGRYDFSSAFGSEAPGVFYPKTSISWVPSDMPSWKPRFGISQLRLRAAIGQSGRQPGAFDKFTTFSPLVSELGAGLAPSNLGNQDLKPEISNEIEGGFELGFLDNRVGLDVTMWNRRVKDALVARQFAPSGGFVNSQLTNIGQIFARGMEIGLKGTAKRWQSFGGGSLDLFANGAYLKQQLNSLGGAPPLKVGYVRYRGYLKAGYPLGSLFSPRLAAPCPGGGTTPAKNKAGTDIACYGPGQFPISLNGNGRAATKDELLAYLAVPRDLKNSGVQSALKPLVSDYDGTGNLTEQFVGDIIPDWTGSVGGTLNWGKNIRIYTLFEYKSGFRIQNLTDGFRLSQHPSIGSNRKAWSEIEATLNNPASTAEQRLAAVDLYAHKYRRLLEPGLHQDQPGDFVRWRELSVTYQFNDKLASKVGARSLSLVGSGRNLLLFTRYPGMDPEINAIGVGFGGIDGNFLDSTDAFGLPIQRRFSLTVNYGF
ncbi:MAG: SusC/RagA family TonB-linked outer membrane protein [Gemmatimonadaceae bacterium]|nr:SusC/RagA family TonB-linked outer membrane protein [Gemmatimonadaceae bacterium]